MFKLQGETTFFLRQRTDFIRFYFDKAIKPFTQIHRDIEAGLPPFDAPANLEDGEPPFQLEWDDAEVALAVVGQTCVSLLADSLKLYLNAWRQTDFRFDFDKAEARVLKTEGFVAAYQAAFAEIIGDVWVTCPVRFEIIEQVVLARNRSQHGASLISLRARHDRKTLEKHPLLFFARPEEAENRVAGEDLFGSYLAPPLRITRETLRADIAEVEALADWLDGNVDHAWSWVGVQMGDGAEA